MKPHILKAASKYQIGRLPNHRVEEHLILVKAIIGRSIERGPDEGAIVELIDIEKLFDSESLRGVMNISLFQYDTYVENKQAQSCMHSSWV